MLCCEKNENPVGCHGHKILIMFCLYLCTCVFMYHFLKVKFIFWIYIKLLREKLLMISVRFGNALLWNCFPGPDR